MFIKKNQNLEGFDKIYINQDVTSMYQSAEWGTRSLQSSIPQIKNRFVYEEAGKRSIMLKMIILLYIL